MPKARKHKYTARTADKHDLYQKAVQSVEREAPYLRRLYKRMRGKTPRLLREDFCGTAALCCEWVKANREHQAVGVDLDQPTLEWGIQNNLSQLNANQLQRVTLIKDDVLHITQPRVDIVAAFNFSYFVFKKREQLKTYFQKVRRSLLTDGIFVLDCYGGSDAVEETEDSKRCSGFTYVWEHATYNPITSETVCHIHFEFRDGSRMRKAFTYDWRLWSLMEIQELLLESGFRHAEVHWEGTERGTEDGNGVFRKTTKGEAIASWIAYVVALA